MNNSASQQRERLAVRHTIDANIGGTPLIGLRRLGRPLPAGVEVFAKAEHLNPGGSVKDRPALWMILDAERRGLLYQGKTILDATSGNTGIAFAMIGAAFGYSITLCLPRNASAERKQILHRYCARIIETDPTQGSDGAQARARDLFQAAPGKYFYADQYNNEANWRAHYESTGVEIWNQTEGRVTHFVAALGTSGTFTGVSRRLKENNAQVRAVSVEPNSPLHGIEGLKHMATARVPGIYDPSLADTRVQVETEEAQGMMKLLAREEGLLVGPSSGANVFAALRLARELPAGSVVVTILCDGGERYLSESYWDRDS
ncbi:MAG TPA: cysteine synthase family protein [Pyrinomonadaceae bacterium]|jgi:cysteine synthase B|nr:cysteine synthase family protein [Pyrinomonadaceae bacterium]